MISRVVSLIFIDSFALAINITLGTVLQSKICNYSWEGECQLENPNSTESISTEMLEEQGDTTV